MAGYNIPHLSPDDLPVNLVPESQESLKTLTPETPVVCMNRSTRELRDTFDSQHYRIPPGPTKFWLAYGAALHFKTRLIVPGTRRGPSSFESMICILGIDDPADCAMFDEMAEAEFSARPEGLDRAALDPSRQNTKVLEVGATRAGVVGQGVGRRANEVFVGAQAVDPADVFTPPEGGSIARAAEAEALGEGYRPGQALTSESGRDPFDDRALTEHVESTAPAAPPIRGMGRGGRR
jgi:hypothetical protein